MQEMENFIHAFIHNFMYKIVYMYLFKARSTNSINNIWIKIQFDLKQLCNVLKSSKVIRKLNIL